jgi:hypothetical protein
VSREIDLEGDIFVKIKMLVALKYKIILFREEFESKEIDVLSSL